ncbi:MAG: ATP-binding protein, partial [Alphaproteobacteria bacterium]|nr:ATP-binding protein [Alphaproteobacteria bacterium]
GVTAGVIGVDSVGHITMLNPSLENMFNLHASDLIGKTILELSPFLGKERIEQLLDLTKHKQNTKYQEQITISQQGQLRVYNVQITQERGETTGKALVITIDDITELVEAHRALAWTEVAKRIAHEIKNPLTPIQLSAERIRRRYSHMIVQDKEIFDKCLNTIVRQVGDIGRMVNEFSAFARMPKINTQLADIRQPLKEASFLIEVSKSGISFEQDFSEEPLWGEFDTRLLGQAFGNVIKNASESIESLSLVERSAKGHILLRAYRNGAQIIVEIIDNGRGLPSSGRSSLLEPYITTRKKGTGLGLAIVRKIVEEHKGYMELHDAPQDFYNGMGAMIRMVFPYVNKIDV